jgi:hypothetical protein
MLDWRGQTVACIASGPSLTKEDCEAVRHLKCIVTNTSFRLALWADALFAMDLKWWTEYHQEVARDFKGELYSWSKVAARYGPESMDGKMAGFGNSGANAISLAIEAGASKVILLGYDCQKTNGLSHWHGDHPKALSNARSIAMWPQKFQRVADYAKKRGVSILNCSRATALKCFERGSL